MNGLKEYGKGGFEGSKPAFDCENLILNSIGVAGNGVLQAVTETWLLVIYCFRRRRRLSL